MIIYCVVAETEHAHHRAFYRNKKQAMKAAQEIVDDHNKLVDRIANGEWITPPFLDSVHISRNVISPGKAGVVDALNDEWTQNVIKQTVVLMREPCERIEWESPRDTEARNWLNSFTE